MGHWQVKQLNENHRHVLLIRRKQAMHMAFCMKMDKVLHIISGQAALGKTRSAKKRHFSLASQISKFQWQMPMFNWFPSAVADEAAKAKYWTQLLYQYRICLHDVAPISTCMMHYAQDHQNGSARHGHPHLIRCSERKAKQLHKLDHWIKVD